MTINQTSDLLLLVLSGCIIAVLALLTGVGVVHAAPLNFPTAESISLFSPPTTLTIATGSVADALGINATSVLVMLSQTTGGSFTLLSPSYDLSVATSSGGGTTTISCSGGIETAMLSQSTGSTVYTVTPGGTNCASASAPIITNVAAANVTTNSETIITWATNIAADSTVSYGTTTSYGLTSTDATLVTAHSVLLSNLSANTLYHYAVASADYGTSTASGDNTFTTAAITGGGGGGTVSTGGGGSAYDLAVNGGALETATTSVTLSLYGTAAYTMKVSNTSNFSGSTWIPYVTSLPWTLAPGMGEQTVFVQFLAISGSVMGSAQASINLVAPSVFPPVSASLSSVTAPSTASLTAELASLQTQLAALLKQAGQSAVAPTSTRFIFTRDLHFGMTGSDVKSLQQFLIRENAGPTAHALKAHGATKNFGTLTFNALIEFQKKAGIGPASGYFGPKTRAYVNALP